MYVIVLPSSFGSNKCKWSSSVWMMPFDPFEDFKPDGADPPPSNSIEDDVDAAVSTSDDRSLVVSTFPDDIASLGIIGPAPRRFGSGCIVKSTFYYDCDGRSVSNRRVVNVFLYLFCVSSRLAV